MRRPEAGTQIAGSSSDVGRARISGPEAGCGRVQMRIGAQIAPRAVRRKCCWLYRNSHVKPRLRGPVSSSPTFLMHGALELVHGPSHSALLAHSARAGTADEC
eukprot:9362954-Heterocapsa_arctica.AAC.1